ncbi:MAG TPA: ShlB/FhaC/HecB family hemolysin secretion/activation protein [Bryobacteraceae bacterium]|nr:ShlB/FhaC/HecB family hemolysin secretion/activation protein [Bryobacteraceae bacterium]
MLKNVCRLGFTGTLLVCLSSLAAAQLIPPSVEPGRERQRFTEPPTPRAQPSGPTVMLPSTIAPAGAAQIRLHLKDIRVVGSTVYSEAELRSLYAPLIGQDISLQEIYEVARAITAKYGNDGYVLSRAIIPPQNLGRSGATVRIQIVEGYVDRVEWPASLSRYRNFFSDYEAKIITDRPVNVRTIERYLLLASDLPGLKFSSSLRPSATQPAAATLVVEVAQKPLDLMARVDNRGTQARGPNEFLTSASFNNLFGQHESLTVSYAGSFQLNELQYIAANYRQVLNSEGLTFFVNASDSWGKPGTLQLETLQYKNRGPYFESGLSAPVVRTREKNLTLTGLFFASNSASNVLDAPFNRDRLRGIRLKADADAADTFNGVNQFNLTFSQGFDGLGSTQNGNPLASRAFGKVDFNKIEGTAVRTQPLFAGFSMQIAAYAQYAFDPLLAPEECGYGGKQFGRAFDPSQFTGDRCWMASAELRYDPPARGGALPFTQVYGFLDRGEISHIQPAAGTPKSQDGTSTGVGVRFNWQNHTDADLSVAKAIDATNNHDWRFFFAVTVRN